MQQDPVIFVVFAQFYYEISLCTPCLCGVLNSYYSSFFAPSRLACRDAGKEREQERKLWRELFFPGEC